MQMAAAAASVKPPDELPTAVNGPGKRKLRRFVIYHRIIYAARRTQGRPAVKPGSAHRQRSQAALTATARQPQGSAHMQRSHTALTRGSAHMQCSYAALTRGSAHMQRSQAALTRGSAHKQRSHEAVLTCSTHTRQRSHAALTCSAHTRQFSHAALTQGNRHRTTRSTCCNNSDIYIMSN